MVHPAKSSGLKIAFVMPEGSGGKAPVAPGWQQFIASISGYGYCTLVSPIPTDWSRLGGH